MTRHVHRAFASEPGELGGTLELAAVDRRHLERVLRMRVGAELEIVDSVGTVFAGELEDAGRVRLRRGRGPALGAAGPERSGSGAAAGARTSRSRS